MSEPFLQLRDLCKRFGKIEALRSVSLELGEDELLVVLGPTGAGKTTLLRTLAGLESPDGGEMRLQGRDLAPLSPAERDVALVFQNFSLYPGWTVRRNIEFPLRAPGRNLPQEEIRRRVEWAAALLKIGPLLERDSTRLSGGEMQRVAIGRAIVRRPKLFLMDEPLTNLDAKLREALRVELVQLRRQLKTPMIFVTHDQAEALSMGDRIAVLSEGRILQTGAPEEIYRRPATPEVARQLGQPPINLIPVRRQGGQWTREGIGLIEATEGVESEAILGVRPEDIDPLGGSHDAQVRVVEDMGATRTLLIRWAGCDLHIVTPKSFSARPGDTIRPVLQAARVVVWGAA